MNRTPSGRFVVVLLSPVTCIYAPMTCEQQQMSYSLLVGTWLHSGPSNEASTKPAIKIFFNCSAGVFAEISTALLRMWNGRNS